MSFALEGSDGCAVSLDHGDFTAHYGHMSKMFVTRCLGRLRRRQYVGAGQVIGYTAKTPLHIRFELWNWTDDRGFVAVDPVPYLNEWRILPPDNELRFRPSPATAQAEAA